MYKLVAFESNTPPQLALTAPPSKSSLSRLSDTNSSLNLDLEPLLTIDDDEIDLLIKHFEGLKKFSFCYSPSVKSNLETHILRLKESKTVEGRDTKVAESVRHLSNLLFTTISSLSKHPDFPKAKMETSDGLSAKLEQLSARERLLDHDLDLFGEALAFLEGDLDFFIRNNFG